MNGHVPAEPNNVFRSANSAFQEQRKSQGAPYSSVNSCSATKQQPRNENSVDYFKHGSPSSWSNVSRYTSSNMTCTTKDYPAVLTRDQRVCDSLTTTKGPHCYISLDSMPQGDRKKDESKLAEVATRCREMVQPREDRMPGIDQEQPAKKLENFTKFVVGVETRLHWEKIRNDSENSNTSKEQDMQIVSVSSTHSPHDDPTEMHSNSSQNESDDAFCMMRLERVYYSISAKPSLHAQSTANSQEQGSEPCEFDADSHKGNLINVHGDTREPIANCEYSSEQSVASRNKTCKGLSLDMKGHKIAHVPVSCLVKRKANISSTKRDEVCIKRKKMEINNSKVSPKGTVTTAWEKVKKRVEIHPTKKLTYQLENGSKAFLEDPEDLKKTRSKGHSYHT